MSEKPVESKSTDKVVKAKKPAGGLAATDVRKKRQVALGAVLAPLMAPALARQGVLLAQIAPHWRAICPLLANHSCPESVKGDVLTVAVASDGVKQELHYITPQVIEGINRLMGYEAIGKVRAVTRHDLLKTLMGRVVERPKASKPDNGAGRDKADAMCKSVRDDDLRAALGRLGAEILKK
jgi:hypothetical protein